jgi:hypothetical protein
VSRLHCVGDGVHERRKTMRGLMGLLILSLCLASCATTGGSGGMLPAQISKTSFTKEMIKIDKQFHEDVLLTAKTRMRYISCDIGLIDGLGLASSADFPINSVDWARALLQNPAISLALGEIKSIAKSTIDPDAKPDQADKTYWKQTDYASCKVVGLGYRVAALSVIDILSLFPQLAPYMALFKM